MTRPSDVHTLRDQFEKDPSYIHVLNMPFDYYQIWIYSFAGRTTYDEVYDLSCHLLEKYSGTRKTFLFGHWEGDWTLRDGGYDVSKDPSEKSIRRMIH